MAGGVDRFPASAGLHLADGVALLHGDRPKPWEGNLLPTVVVPPVVALASGPPQSSGGVVRARMIRTWRRRKITGRSNG